MNIKNEKMIRLQKLQILHRLQKWKDCTKKECNNSKNAKIAKNSENAAKLRSAKIAKCKFNKDCNKCEKWKD